MFFSRFQIVMNGVWGGDKLCLRVELGAGIFFKVVPGRLGFYLIFHVSIYEMRILQ